MPHQCVRCGTLYGDGDDEILKGCSCGAKLFFFVKEKNIDKAEEINKNLSNKEKEEIEKDILELVKQQKTDEEEKPIILDLESIHVPKPGKYELDIVHIFKNDPMVIRTGDGKYIIDLAEAFLKSKED